MSHTRNQSVNANAHYAKVNFTKKRLLKDSPYCRGIGVDIGSVAVCTVDPTTFVGPRHFLSVLLENNDLVALAATPGNGTCFGRK